MYLVIITEDTCTSWSEGRRGWPKTAPSGIWWFRISFMSFGQNAWTIVIIHRSSSIQLSPQAPFSDQIPFNNQSIQSIMIQTLVSIMSGIVIALIVAAFCCCLCLKQKRRASLERKSYAARWHRRRSSDWLSSEPASFETQQQSTCH